MEHNNQNHFIPTNTFKDPTSGSLYDKKSSFMNHTLSSPISQQHSLQEQHFKNKETIDLNNEKKLVLNTFLQGWGAGKFFRGSGS